MSAESPRRDDPATEPVDGDPLETAEWQDALASVLRTSGPGRVRELMDLLSVVARDPAVGWQPAHGTPYLNTIPAADQPPFPGDLAIEERLASIMRWNALAMVVRANQAYGELGGHIASYTSAADLFEVGFNHFFRADTDHGRGDLVFYQPHSAPGVYARAFLEGRLERRRPRALPPGTRRLRARRARAEQLSAPVADAGLLAVPDRLDGPRADQLDLAGALHAVPARSSACSTRAGAGSGACSATARWTSRRA